MRFSNKQDVPTLKLIIEESFFQAEERDGYRVPPEMKKVWAVELDLLNEFARVCKEHDLKWFAHAGTLLGAIRHQGFIPWDDDIDVTMPRADYIQLCNVAPKAFKYPYFFQTDDTDLFFCRSFARLRNSDTTAIQVWEKSMNFPYNQGVFIDIFPYDNLPDNDVELGEEIRKMEALINSAWQFRNMVHFYHPKTGKGLKKRISYYLKHLWFKYIDPKGGDYLKFLQQHTALATSHNDEDTQRVGEMIIPPFGRHIWKKEWVEETISVPFEMITIQVPTHYEECLKIAFGEDWRTPRQIGNYHGQILFDVDRPYTHYLNQNHS